eukprot:CAMPEP_0117657906 /NCGR_PEP_ID=MMETSP0804-20121206/5579_1 /TAXON_ID=1074897 /ORGANISM="Tetraselmis astigmatica, Strain CCMP880" /LENGTH=580 /DNA_ID=CAMNT_0005464389 /DNA_START=112 /DNA_END=1851 /DNA_ORIENTATION=-
MSLTRPSRPLRHLVPLAFVLASLLQGVCVQAQVEIPVARYDPIHKEMYEDGFKPDDPSYYASAAFVTGIAGATLVGGTIVVSVLFLCIRCGCMCCGHGFWPHRPSTNSMETEETPVPLLGRIVVQAIVVVLSLGVIAGAALTLIGTEKVDNAVRGLVDVTIKEKGINQLQHYAAELEMLISDALAVVRDMSEESLPGLYEVVDVVAEVRGQVTEISDDVMDQADTVVDTVLKGAQTASLVIACLIIVMVLQGIAGAVFGSCRLLTCPLVTVPLWLVFAWVLYTVFHISHTVMSDVCTDVAGTYRYCTGLEQNDRLCRSYFIGNLLSTTLDTLDGDAKLIEVTGGINELVEQANSELEAAYNQICGAVDSANLALGGGSIAISQSDLCLRPETRKYLCLPFTADGRLDADCGTDTDSQYTKLSEASMTFKALLCEGVADMQVELTATVETSLASRRIPSGPEVTCAINGQFVGTSLYDDVTSKAEAAGEVFDSFDLIIDLLDLVPLWVIMESLANQDCPATVDALKFLWVAFCVLGACLIALSITWLVAAQRLTRVRAVQPAAGTDVGPPVDNQGERYQQQ